MGVGLHWGFARPFRDLVGMDMVSCQVTKSSAGSPCGTLVICCTRRRRGGGEEAAKSHRCSRIGWGEENVWRACNPEMRGL